MFYSYVVHKTTIITQSLGLCYFNKIHSVCAVHITASNFGRIQQGVFFLPKNNSEYSPVFKTVLLAYENILRDALHRLQEGVLYFLSIRRFYGTFIIIISCTRKIKLLLYPSRFTRNLILLINIMYGSSYRILPQSDNKCGERRV